MTSRRLLYAIAIGVFVFAGVSVGLQLTDGIARNVVKPDIVRMLRETRIMLRDLSGSATEAINVLRDKYGVPVSFISVSDEKAEPVQFRDEEVKLGVALDEFVQTRNAYTHSLVGGRLMVYPKSGPYTKVIAGIDVRNAPRFEAIHAFVELLKRTHTEFLGLLGPIMRGDRRAPIYADRVSLPKTATVLEHFAALLGDDPNVMFSIVDWRNSGNRYLLLEQVKSAEAKPAPDAKDAPTAKPPGD